MSTAGAVLVRRLVEQECNGESRSDLTRMDHSRRFYPVFAASSSFRAMAAQAVEVRGIAH